MMILRPPAADAGTAATQSTLVIKQIVTRIAKNFFMMFSFLFFDVMVFLFYYRIPILE
jgi:hypothetical protein